jgi:hypothetical protein
MELWNGQSMIAVVIDGKRVSGGSKREVICNTDDEAFHEFVRRLDQIPEGYSVRDQA